MPLKSGSWMVHVDERILEHLRETESELTAWEIAVDIDARAGLVRARCETLTHAGFLRRRDRDRMDARYSLSLWGRLYLDGEIDADLRRPTPRPRPAHAVRPGWFVGVG